ALRDAQLLAEDLRVVLADDGGPPAEAPGRLRERVRTAGVEKALAQILVLDLDEEVARLELRVGENVLGRVDSADLHALPLGHVHRLLAREPNDEALEHLVDVLVDLRLP